MDFIPRTTNVKRQVSLKTTLKILYQAVFLTKTTDISNWMAASYLPGLEVIFSGLYKIIYIGLEIETIHT